MLKSGICVIFTLVLEILRSEFDNDRDESKKFHLSDLRVTIESVLTQQSLRTLAFGCFAFVGLQTAFVAFFVIYLTEIGYSLLEAGAIFSVATAVAIPGRIFWGWLSSCFIQPKAMLNISIVDVFSGWDDNSLIPLGQLASNVCCCSGEYQCIFMAWRNVSRRQTAPSSRCAAR